jgi:hypothetical protein
VKTIERIVEEKKVILKCEMEGEPVCVSNTVQCALGVVKGGNRGKREMEELKRTSSAAHLHFSVATCSVVP